MVLFSQSFTSLTHFSSRDVYRLHSNLPRHVTVRGQVQGVGFRYFVVQRVLDIRDRNLGLEGWVRNRSDGTVEALIKGAPDAIEAMLSDLRSGPSGARVETVRLVDLVPSEQRAEGTFEIRPTA